jgi:preprotein translocase subunit SecG
MNTFLLIVHIVVCVLLIAVVLFQDGKAGGLTSVSDASQSVFGARGAAKFLMNLTLTLAVLFMATSISLHLTGSKVQKSIASDYAAPQTKTDANVTAPPATGEAATTEAPAADATQTPAPAPAPATDTAPATGGTPVPAGQ